MDLSVIIVNYNVRYFLEQALMSVRKASQHLNTEVWVVDNNSIDGSVEMVREKFPEVKVIANSGNEGFSKANNQAIRQSTGRYVLLLNPDTVVEELTFKKVADFMDAHPDAGGLGVRMIDGKGHFLPESKRGLPTPAVAFYKLFGLSKLFPTSKTFGRYHLGYIPENKTAEIEVLSGAFMLLRAEALAKTGLLDEDYFMYGEDIDLSYRIIKAGYKNYYFPETTIIHYKGESTKKTSVNYVFVFYKAMVIFAQKHFGAGKAGLFSLLINGAIWLRAGAALAHRAALQLWQPLLDSAIIYSGLYWSKIYWEQNHRFVEGGMYPPEYMLINAPVYTLLWVAGIAMAGGYAFRHRLKNIWRGLFLGTMLIAIVYAFAPESYRFSRALILLGAAWALITLSAYRVFIHFLRHKNFDYGQSGELKLIVAGSKAEAKRAGELVANAGAGTRIIGRVSGSEETNPELSENFLGRWNQLPEVISIFRPDEVIFCGADVSGEAMIAMMSQLNGKGPRFKILPEKSLFIIGSNHKNDNGEWYTIDIKLNLAGNSAKSEKRLFDLMAALLLLPLVFALALLRPAKFSAVKNLAQVLGGNMTWVGYSADNSENRLPALKPGILSTNDQYNESQQNIISNQKADFFYARDYSPAIDLEIVIKNLKKVFSS